MKMTEAVSSLPSSARLKGEILLPVVAFLVPFLVSGPQWLTGTLVNGLLFLTVLTLSEQSLWLVIVLPSIGALSHGALFGRFTPFLAFFLPVIWAANFLLVRSFTFLLPNVPSPVAVLLSAALKALLLYLAALAYFRLQWVPQPFLVSMGVIQFTTAVIGGLLALGILRFTSVR